eukprot:scaffold25445_cov183-Amphora_coffeaeformis.AAC.6
MMYWSRFVAIFRIGGGLLSYHEPLSQRYCLGIVVRALLLYSDQLFHDIFGEGSAITLRNFLSFDECQNYIRFAEHSGLTSCGYSSSIRVIGPLEVESERAANSLYERTRPLVNPCVDLTGEQDWPRGIPRNFRQRKYYPCGLNKSLRICRYEEGGFFLPHHDGAFDLNEFERSLYTFMVYLNDNFRGGTTKFYREDRRHYIRGVPYSYRPQRGDVAIFHSRIVHDGGLATEGYKYILRGEVMCSAIGDTMEDTSHEPDHDELDEANAPDEGETFDLVDFDEAD